MLLLLLWLLLLLLPDLSAKLDRFSSRGKLNRCCSSLFRASVKALTDSVPLETRLSVEMLLLECPFKLDPFWALAVEVAGSMLSLLLPKY